MTAFIREGPGRTSAYKLYNLDEDIGETADLAGQYPEIVLELDGMISRHLEETGAVIPVTNPAYDPGAESPMGQQSVFPIENYPSYPRTQ